MLNMTQQPEISCEFTPPSVDMGAFYSHRTGTPLEVVIDHAGVVVEAIDENQDIEGIRWAEWEAVTVVAQAVRESVKYCGGVKPWLEKPEGDCFTFTWLISDAVERIGMQSRIVFSNDHAFNIAIAPSGTVHLINGESKQMWFFDAPNNPVAQDMFDKNTWNRILELEQQDMVVETLYTDRLKAYSDKALEANKNGLTLLWLNDHNPAATVMGAEKGRAALFAYSCFEDALRCGDLKAAKTSLKALGGNNPQQETRAKINPDLNRFKSLVKKWSMSPGVPPEEIAEAIALYEAVMPNTKSMLILAGDCYRVIGDRRCVPDLLHRALTIYSHAFKKSKSQHDQTLAGKQNKTRYRLAELETTAF